MLRRGHWNGDPRLASASAHSEPQHRKGKPGERWRAKLRVENKPVLVILALGRHGEADYQFKAILGYIRSSCFISK